MPLVDGFEVLGWIKQRHDLASVAVVVLTSSDREEDLHRAKALGAASYLTKTVLFGNVVHLLQATLQASS
jgi:CheY-like chemotaxis protein